MNDDDRIEDVGSDGTVDVCSECGQPCIVADDGTAHHLDTDHDDDHVPGTDGLAREDQEAEDDRDHRRGLHGPEYPGEQF